MKLVTIKKIINQRILLISTHILSVIALVQTSFWNPSAVNDGVVYPQSIVVYNGGILYRDIQEQYGSFVPTLQGLLFKIIGTELWKSRLIGTTVLLLTGYLFFYLLTKKIEINNAFLILNFYFATFSVWNSFSSNYWPGEGLVWPNYYGLLLILATLILISTLKNNDNTKIYNLSKLTFIAICICLLPTVRIEFLFPSMVLIIWTIAKIKNSKRYLGSFLSIILFVIFAFYIYLESTKSFIPWYEQLISPLVHGDYGYLYPSSSIIAKDLIAIFTEIFILAILFKVVNYLLPNNKFLQSLFIFLIAILFVCLGYLTRQREIQGNQLFSLIKIVSSDFILNIGKILILVISVLIICELMLKVIKRIMEPNFVSPSSDKDATFLKILSLSLLPQVFHNFSVEYFHMILPVFLLLYVSNNYISRKTYLNYFHFTNQLFVSITLASLSIFIYAATLSTYSFTQNNLVYMKIHDLEKYRYYSWIEKSINSYSQGKLLMTCGTGLFSVTGNQYILNSIYPMPGLTPEILTLIEDKVDSETVVLDCKSLSDFKNLKSQGRFKILDEFVFNSDNVTFFYKLGEN